MDVSFDTEIGVMRVTKSKSGHKMWVFGASLLLTLAGAGLTACGSSQQEDTEAGLMCRLTSVSDTKVVVEVFERGEGHPPNAASGGAADGKMPSEPDMGKRPEGTPPADFKNGKKPEGTPPADAPEMKRGDGGENRDSQENGKTRKKGESKTFVLDEGTKIYKQDGEEKTEISAGELELGSMLSVVADGDTAKTITVQSGERQKRGELHTAG